MTGKTKQELQRLRDLATMYKTVVLLVGAQWLVLWFTSTPTTPDAPRSGGEQVIGTIGGLVVLGIAAMLADRGYRLARLLDRSLPLIYAIGMFIPLVNLIFLLILSSASQAVCREHGIRVGLFGPKRDDIEKLEAAARDAVP